MSEKLEYSPVFTMYNKEGSEMKFRFQIYPKGREETDAGFVSIYLQNESDFDISSILRYLFIVKIYESTHIIKDSYGTFMKKGFVKTEKESSAWGSSKAIKISALKNGAFLHGEDLIIGAFIRDPKEDYTKSDDYKESLADRFTHELNFDLNSQKNNMESLSDLEVKCGEEEKSFFCHKVILAMSSSVFKTMFENSNTSDGTKAVITLTEDPETIAALLNFMYTGRVEKSIMACKLLLASDKYNMEPLQKRCEAILGQYFEKFENVDNLVEIALASYKIGSKEYQETVVGSLAANWIKVTLSEHLEDIKNDSALLEKITSYLANMHNCSIDVK